MLNNKISSTVSNPDWTRFDAPFSIPQMGKRHATAFMPDPHDIRDPDLESSPKLVDNSNKMNSGRGNKNFLNQSVESMFKNLFGRGQNDETETSRGIDSNGCGGGASPGGTTPFTSGAGDSDSHQAGDGNSNSSDITTNSSDITTNSSDITTNSSNTTTNSSNTTTNSSNTPAQTSPGEIDETKDDRPGDKKVKVLFVTKDGKLTPDMAKQLQETQEIYRKAGVKIDLEAVTDTNGRAFKVSDLQYSSMTNGLLEEVNSDFDNKSSQTGQLREKYQADMVVAVDQGSGGNIAGISWVDGYAAAVDGDGTDTLAHELGHSFGLIHSHEDPGADANTVMSYNPHDLRLSVKEAGIVSSNLDKRSNGFENWV